MKKIFLFILLLPILSLGQVGPMYVKARFSSFSDFTGSFSPSTGHANGAYATNSLLPNDLENEAATKQGTKLIPAAIPSYNIEGAPFFIKSKHVSRDQRFSFRITSGQICLRVNPVTGRCIFFDFYGGKIASIGVMLDQSGASDKQANLLYGGSGYLPFNTLGAGNDLYEVSCVGFDIILKANGAEIVRLKESYQFRCWVHRRSGKPCR